MTGSVTQLVLAIISKDSRTPLERWIFDITLVEPAPDSDGFGSFFLLRSFQLIQSQKNRKTRI